MSIQFEWRVSCARLAVILVLILSACSRNTPATPAAPTWTAVLSTATSLPTATASSTATPAPTATLTEPPAPTATFTPNVTATQLPEIPPPMEGKANIAGLVLWNDQPVPGAAVWLCEDFSGTCTSEYQYRVNTDTNGYFVFNHVVPREYSVAVNSFNTRWFIFYFNRNGSYEQTVSAGENLILDPWNIWKFDLRINTPKINQVLSEAKPTFSWEAYPGAAYYQISLYDVNSKSYADKQRVDGLAFTPAEPLVACKYHWDVEAFNEQGVKIASTDPDETFFNVVDVPGQC